MSRWSPPLSGARIVAIDTAAAMEMPGVHRRLTGEELSQATEPLCNGLDTPKVRRFPLAVDRCVMPANGWWRSSPKPAPMAEDAAEKVRVEYEPLPYVIDPEAGAATPSQPAGACRARQQRAARQDFVWGEVDKHFAESPRHLSFRVTLGSQLDGADRNLRRRRANGIRGAKCSTSGPRSRCRNIRIRSPAALRIPGNNVRVHQDVDVGGSYGVKRGIKQTVIVGYLARLLGGRCG